MLKSVSKWFVNLPIRRKLGFGFGFLIALLLLVIISNMMIEYVISDPASRSLKEASADMLLATRIGFAIEQARYEERIFETIYRGESLEKGSMTSAYDVVVVHLNDALDLLNTADTSNKSREEVERVEALRSGLEIYITDILIIMNEMLPGRGTITEGLGADIYRPLERINAVVDASAAMQVTESYVNGFGGDALLSFTRTITDLRQTIADSNLSTEKKDTLYTEIATSQDAFRVLVAHDALLVQHFVAMNEEADVLATQTISEYVAVEQQKRDDAKARMEKASHLRSVLGWTIGSVTVLVALAMGRLIAQSISKPVVELGNVSRKVAEGDYSQRAAATSSDEVGQLARTFNTTITAVSEREAQLREQTNQLRIATAQAREAARIKGEFLANVSHELRTPLNAIIGFSDMLLMGMNGEMNEKQTHKIRRLRENGMRLLDLINDILDLTRIEARRVELISHPFASRALFTRVSGQMDVLAQEKGLAFTTDISPDLPETLVGDEKRIEQIVVNLLSNAFKFTQEGSVALSTQANLAEQTWSIKVSDTGVGIPPHARNLIFEEFRQLDGSSTRKHGGSGLGLAITRNLVRIMKGDIVVESELGKGSTFTVTLPLSTEDVPQENTTASQHVEAYT